MKKALAFFGFLAFLGGSSCVGASPQDDSVRIRALENAFVTGMNNKDLDAVMAAYAPGNELLVFDVVGPPGVHFGWNAYHDAFSKMFSSIRGPLHLTIGDLRVEASGDIGFGSSLQRVSGTRENDGKPFAYTVRVTDVYRKRAGRWLIVQEHLSLPIDRNTFVPIRDFTD